MATPREAPQDLVARGYDTVAERYAALEGAVAWPRMRWLKGVLDQIPRGSRVLDIGCGNGVPATREIAREHEAVGVDVSVRQVELARGAVPTVEVEDEPGVTGEWLGVPMYFSSFDADTSRRLVREAGFELLADEVEVQLEGARGPLPVDRGALGNRKGGIDMSESAKDAWRDVGDRFATWGRRVAGRYQEERSAGSAEAEETERELQHAAKDLVDEIARGVSALGDTLRDEEARKELAEAMNAVGDAISATVNETSEAIRAGRGKQP